MGGDELLAALDQLAVAGLACLAVRPGGKAPAGPWANGEWTAARLQSYLTNTAGAGIGIICGAASGGLVVIDVDRHGVDGRRYMADFERGHGRLPVTVTALTPSGGVHLYYRMPAGAPAARNAANAGIGVDVRGEGGYAVAPPTVLPVGSYRWADGLSPDDVEIAVADGRVTGLLRELQGGGRAGTAKAAPLAGLPIRQGGRNDAVFRYAAHVRAMGGSDLDVATMAAGFNALWCRPPLGERELLHVIESACRYERGESLIGGTAGLPDVSRPGMGGGA